MIDPSVPLPKYLQLRALLLDTISRLPMDALIPSERELCRRFNVSRTTVRQAVDQLVVEERLRRVPGKGMVVARPPNRFQSFADDMHALGMSASCVDLGTQTIEADADLADLLGTAPGAPVHVLHRLRLADGQPMAVERSYIPAALAPDLFERRRPGGSLFKALEREFGIVTDTGDQTIEAGPATDNEAEPLDIPQGGTVFHLRRRTFSRGACAELTFSTYRADRYRIHLGLKP
ncbi:GntR family transcriptional regulator [Actinomadura barringtoniae]|uniref:GntR family transcriptional regulator n=1 Tax=Actinomadura barringtoniae TaxID=1427535 RepID=A0A939PIH9_9ACTN|nr:GntR family transcriptional regulator [Actinomadura barringtoniae]MBO2450693.1 GntR family transcriptional regulator [Actinomadura barringtoniae]